MIERHKYPNLLTIQPQTKILVPGTSEEVISQNLFTIKVAKVETSDDVSFSYYMRFLHIKCAGITLNKEQINQFQKRIYDPILDRDLVSGFTDAIGPQILYEWKPDPQPAESKK